MILKAKEAKEMADAYYEANVRDKITELVEKWSSWVYRQIKEQAQCGGIALRLEMPADFWSESRIGTRNYGESILYRIQEQVAGNGYSWTKESAYLTIVGW